MIAVAAITALGLTWLIRAELGSRWGLVEAVVGLFCTFGMLYAAAAQVLARYALGDLVEVSWTEEFARLLLVWAALWGAAMLQRSDDHIAMTVFFDWLPPRGQLAARLFGDLVTLAVLAVVAWYGWTTAYRQLGMSTVSLGLPIAVFIVPVALSATLMIVHTVGVMGRRLRGQPVGSGATPAA